MSFARNPLERVTMNQYKLKLGLNQPLVYRWFELKNSVFYSLYPYGLNCATLNQNFNFDSGEIDMVLKTCIKCSQGMEQKLKKCPHCGTRQINKITKFFIYLGLIIGIPFFGLIFAFILSDIPNNAPLTYYDEHGQPSERPKNGQKALSQSTVATKPINEEKTVDNSYRTKKGYLVAHTKEDLDLAVQMVIDKDEKALDQLIDSDRVFISYPGKKVFLVDNEVFSGLSQIRFEGDTETFWTLMEAIERK
jgi:hypothetical protein